MLTRFLLVSGSLRRASTNSALLRTAALAAPQGSTCRLYDRLGNLPAFNPDEDRHPLLPEVERLRNVIHEANASSFPLLNTPEPYPVP